jgi:hypothetical protein
MPQIGSKNFFLTPCHSQNQNTEWRHSLSPAMPESQDFEYSASTVAHNIITDIGTPI